MTTTITKIQNYQGTNSFVLKIKDSLSKYGKLTDKQLSAVEKILSVPTTVKVEEMSEELQKIAKYEGQNTFLNDIKTKLIKFGTLTQSQINAALKQIETESNRENTHKMTLPTPGETIKIGRSIGQKLKEQYGLKFNPILIDITKVLAVSPKAVKFSGKLTVKRGDVCTCCMKTLTDEFSMLTGMGKICAKHVGVSYITDKSQAEKFRMDYLKRVEEIGEMEMWVPKSKILKWEGKTEIILKMI